VVATRRRKMPRRRRSKIGSNKKIETNKPTDSFDEFFGYSTKQTISKTKKFADQDVGLGICLLDPPATSGSLRSLLIVQRIDPRGLFARSRLGVGDTILSINGVGFKDPYGNKNHRKSFQPNLFKARALVNARVLRVTIEYQKFGETNSAASSTIFSDETNSIKNQKEGLPTQEPVPKLTRDSFTALSPPRPGQVKQPRSSATSIDFTGNLRTTDTDRSSSSKTIDRSSLKSMFDSDEASKQQERQVSTPPKISRLTRLKARTQVLRSNGHKKIEFSKKKQTFWSKKEKGNKGKSGVGETIDGGYGKENTYSYSSNNININTQISNETTVPPEGNRGTNAKDDESSLLAYGSLLNHGPEEQIQLLKERVRSSDFGTDLKTTHQDEIMGLTDEDEICEKTTGHHDQYFYKNVCSPALCSPARSTRSESYLHNLRKGLSPTATAVFDDHSVAASTIEQYEDILRQRNDYLQSNSELVTEEHHKELVRINRKVFDKLQTRIDILKRNNMQLSDDMAAFRRKRDDRAKKLSQAEKLLEQADAKEQVLESQLGLIKSRLEISTIQADKRHREITALKEKAIAENNKIITSLKKRIEGLEEGNRRLLEQMQKVEIRRQEKYKSLKAQFDRLKMKFSAQSTLLDNVMTANEELTSQNEAMEAELMAIHLHHRPPVDNKLQGTTSKTNPAVANTTSITSAATGIFFAEGSENDVEHIKRDPILLAQAKELSSTKERNDFLEEQVESLSTSLREMTHNMHNAKSQALLSSATATVVASNTTAKKNLTTPSLLDVTINSKDDSGDESIVDSSNSIRQLQDNAPNNTSLESLSDEKSYLPRCISQLPSTTSNEKVCCGGDGGQQTTVRLHYQHEYSRESRTTEHLETRTPTTKTWKHVLSPPAIDESFESSTSLVLMERILELETALQQTDPDKGQTERFLVALQSRISKLSAKGYEKIASVDIASD